MSLKERLKKGRKDEEEEVSRYSITLTKKERIGSWKRLHQIALSEKLALEKAMDVSQGRIQKKKTLLENAASAL